MRCAALFGVLVVVIGLSEARTINSDRLWNLGKLRKLHRGSPSLQKRLPSQREAEQQVEVNGDVDIPLAAFNAIMYAGGCFLAEEFWWALEFTNYNWFTFDGSLRSIYAFDKDDAYYTGGDEGVKSCFYAIREVRGYIKNYNDKGKRDYYEEFFREHSHNYTCKRLAEMEVRFNEIVTENKDEEQSLVNLNASLHTTVENSCGSKKKRNTSVKDQRATNREKLLERISRLLSSSEQLTKRSAELEEDPNDETAVLEAFEFLVQCVVKGELKTDKLCKVANSTISNYTSGSASERTDAVNTMIYHLQGHKCSDANHLAMEFNNYMDIYEDLYGYEKSAVQLAVNNYQDDFLLQLLSMGEAHCTKNPYEIDLGSESSTDDGDSSDLTDIDTRKLEKLLLSALSKTKK